MCELGEVTRECGAATPGIAKVYGVDVDDVVSIPSPNADWTIPTSIILKPGKYWKDLPFVEDKAGLVDEIADAVGGGFAKSIPLKFSKYSPQTNKWVNNAIGARFIAIVADNNSQMILVGDKVAALRLQKATGNTGQKSGDENGWDMTLQASGVKPCFFYTGDVLLEAGSDDTVYDTTLTFASSRFANSAGVGCDTNTPNATISFEFDGIDPRPGTPLTMNIYVSSALAMIVDGTTDYAGQPYRFTDAAGTIHTGTFTSGDVHF